MEERRCCKIGWGLENVTRKKANFFGQQKKGKCDVRTYSAWNYTSAGVLNVSAVTRPTHYTILSNYIIAPWLQ